MLSLLSPNRVTFSVNVFGTAATPTVRCVIGDDPGLQFPAVKLNSGEYEATIQFPAYTQPGAHSFKIEVLLNGRLFTPIQTSITVNDDKSTVAPSHADQKMPAPKLITRIDAEVRPKVKLPELSANSASVKKVKSTPSELDNLSKIAKMPAAPLPKRKTEVGEIKQVKINMAEIANEAVREKTAPAVKKPQQIAESKGIPITLTKGDIIYR